MKTKKYAKGGSLKPVPAGKTGLSKLPTEVRNKMGYMMGGGKLDMMYQNGGMMTGKKKQDPPRKITDVLDRNGRVIAPERRKLEAAADAMKLKNAEATFNRNARLAQEANLTQERNTIKKNDPDALAAFDRSLKARGYKVVARPAKKMANGGIVPKATKYTDISKYDLPHEERVAFEDASRKKMVKELDLKSGKETGKNIMLKTYVKPKAFAQGGKMKKPGAPNPLNPTKDKDSFISNAVDMSPATKKQMMALRQAMMYFTGVSPKNK
jgi:hypothetical protein